jgi:hypothetical protein
MSIKESPKYNIVRDLAALKSVVFGALSEDIEGTYKLSFVNRLRFRLLAKGPFKDFSQKSKSEFLRDIATS